MHLLDRHFVVKTTSTLCHSFNLLVRLVVVVGVDRVLHTVLDELLESGPLADELDEFGDAATAAEHNKFFLFEQELLNRAPLLLIQKLVDLHVASIISKKSTSMLE